MGGTAQNAVPTMSTEKHFVCVIAVLCCGLNTPACAQAVTGGDNAVPAYLMRMERLRVGEDVCVLMNQSGQYRLERKYPSTTQVFLGSLSPAELQQLHATLNADGLQKLSQSQIPHFLVSDTLDEVLIDIFRSASVQNLAFNTPESRKRFRGSVDPLLRWLDGVQKQHHVQLHEESASHCMPPKASVADVAAREPHSRATSLPFLMMMHTEHVNGGFVENRCVIVYPDGRYRREKSTQRFESTRKVQAFESTLRNDQVTELETLLDAQPIRSLQHNNLSNTPFREMELTTVAIPRGESVQQLAFSSSFGFAGNPKSAGGMSDNRGLVDHEVHLIQPLQHWVKGNIERDKVPALPDPQATGCRPIP